MAPEEERRGSTESGKGDFDGRDLLVGRPEGAAGRSTAAAPGTPQAAISPQPGAHDDAIREILETVRATAARIDALQDAPEPEHETAEALARETAALTQAVVDARGALAKAAELAARRDGQAAAGRVAQDRADGTLAGPWNGEAARRARAMPAAEAHPLKGRSDGTTLYGDGSFSSFPGCSLNRSNLPRIRLSCLLT